MSLTLIFLFLNIFFSISLGIAESPKISVVPFLHSSLFCCAVLLSAYMIFSVGAVLISFLGLTCSSECFTVCFTSIAEQFLVFELREYSCLEDLSITTSKSPRDGLLLTVLVLTGVSNLRIIGKKFFLLLNSVSIELNSKSAVLLRHYYMVFQWF